MRYKPYEYQKTAQEWIINHTHCGLFLDMGLGKTVCTLTAIQDLIDDCEITNALVVAPKKVAETTWTTEAQKWDHLKSLRVAKVMGTPKKRKQALQQQADVYVISRDNYTWLVGLYSGVIPFDMLVIDELTSFKAPKSLRFKTMRISLPAIKRVVGLTGTPAPNGYKDLWGQMYCLDRGARLERTAGRYHELYFDRYMHGNMLVRCDLKPGCQKIIKDKIKDICLSMAAKDYLQLPKLRTIAVKVNLSDPVMKGYKKFEKDKVLEFFDAHADQPKNILANSAVGLMNKLSQYANGAVYDEDGGVHAIHDEKLDRLAELVEAANGSSVLVYYQYRHDISRITKRLKGYHVEVYQGEKQLLDWNAGKIDVLLAHPASTAYGLNMQAGGHYIVWFGTGWNLELYLQANARLFRQGQLYPVTVYKLLCANTVDERANEALSKKTTVQQGLLDSLNYLANKYKALGYKNLKAIE